MNNLKMNQQLKFRILLKEVCLECLSVSTVHALPNLSRSSTHVILKIIWVLCLLACFSYCIVYIRVYPKKVGYWVWVWVSYPYPVPSTQYPIFLGIYPIPYPIPIGYLNFFFKIKLLMR